MKYNQYKHMGGKSAGKRRKLNKRKFFSTMSLLVLLIAAVYILYINDTFDKIRDSVFTISEGTQDLAGVTTGDDTQSTSSTDYEETSDTTGEETSGEYTAEPTDTNDNEDSSNQNPSSNEDTQKPERDIAAIKSELEDYIKGYKGQYGIHYLNLADGTEFGINDTDEYIAASTVKVPINLLLFKRIQSGLINPEGTMTYTQADYEGGTGSIQYKKVGTKFKVRELSRLSIEQSDNVATNMLIRLLGGRSVYKGFMREVGGTVVDAKKNISSPKDMALYMKLVYEFYNDDKELGSELMNYLENTIFNDRIPKLLPEDIKVAHKIGNQVGALHDVGIVYAEEPYIISIMSKEVIEAEAYDVIANISRKVYDFSTGGR